MVSNNSTDLGKNEERSKTLKYRKTADARKGPI